MPLLPWCPPLQPREDLGQASAMKNLYLLFPFFLLLVQGAAGVSLTPRNESQCKQEGGFCSFLTCYHPNHFFGRCSAFMVCCKR
uniref:Beta-defensin-like domain-containing protein n=1 Tax=Accipiter nisus TaxID=211598 RepID=A0A8B9MPD5_9AVES